MANAATDTQKQIDRDRAIFTRLLRQLPPGDRERHLAKHADDLQRSIDGLLWALDGGNPSGPPAQRAPVPRLLAASNGPASSSACDVSSVPGAVRAVLATEAAGLSTRAIAEGVNVLRPGTGEAAVSCALHQMRKRGELAREGFHKNYRYRVAQPANGNGPSAGNTLQSGGAAR